MGLSIKMQKRAVKEVVYLLAARTEKQNPWEGARDKIYPSKAVLRGLLPTGGEAQGVTLTQSKNLHWRNTRTEDLVTGAREKHI